MEQTEHPGSSRIFESDSGAGPLESAGDASGACCAPTSDGDATALAVESGRVGRQVLKICHGTSFSLRRVSSSRRVPTS